MEFNHFTMKQYMAIVAERDAAIKERNLALTDRKTALAERDMAFLERDAAIAERNAIIMERDEAFATLRRISMNSDMNGGLPGSRQAHRAKHVHHGQQQQQMQIHHQTHLDDAPYIPREVPFSDSFPMSAVDSGPVKPKTRLRKSSEEISVRKSKSSMKVKGAEDLEQQIIVPASNGWKHREDEGVGDEDINKQVVLSDSGSKLVDFDELTIPAPYCSCTGEPQQCYKWGNGGWQSACCTTTLSMHPLPQMDNKRHQRVGGRKMSGSVFSKLIHRLAGEGYDLSVPLDLKDHWAKHGTNRYITIK